jgi:hypothetical protein
VHENAALAWLYALPQRAWLAWQPRLSLAGQSAANADGGGDRPLDHPDSAGDAEPGQEAEALMAVMSEDRQVHAYRRLVVMIAVAVVRCPAGDWPATVASSCLLSHRLSMRA